MVTYLLFATDFKTCGAHNFAHIKYPYILRDNFSNSCILRPLAKKSALVGLEPG